MKLSIIIPVFNTSEYLRQCMDSVLSQDIDDCEIIVVDDGSIDGSADIIRSYEISHPSIRILQQQHKGVSPARNFGLEHARGEYVVFVDSDDWIEPNIYSRIIEQMRETGADMVACGFIIEPEGRIPNLQHFKFTHAIDNYADLAMHSYIRSPFSPMLWNKLFRLDTIRTRSIRFPEEMNYGEDAYFNLHYVNSISSIAPLDDILYHYRYRPGSLSHNPNKDRHICHLKNEMVRNSFYVSWGLASRIPEWKHEDRILDIISKTVSVYHLGGPNLQLVGRRLNFLRSSISGRELEFALDEKYLSGRNRIDRWKLRLFKYRWDRLLYLAHRIYHRRYRKKSARQTHDEI